MIQPSERFEAFTSEVIKAYKSVNRIKTREMEAMGLKGNYTLYVFYLGKSAKGLTGIELCKICNEDKAAVSRTLSELTELGIVEQSEEDSSKRYRTKFKLTAKGRAVHEQVESAIANVVNKAAEGFDESERKCFYKVFVAITDNLDKICKSLK